MKKDEDFRIQKLLDQKMKGIENQAPETIDAEDLEAYEVLYGHLKEKPGQGLSLSFKSNVLRKIETERKQASDTKFYWLLGFMLLAGMVVIASLFLIFKDALAPSLGVLDKYKGFILIGVSAIVSFNLVERKLQKHDPKQ
ncbi:hypothetical protein [Pseudozobellia sp. WGM2]|uniref:hypothetical protein n=1 Tax=Pseudozobellia sp. WGM2 TaxID=2787625 RepID=UPI001ADF23E0|nr:hypothetical protein [Pseudozobellia sp. WGM2]